MANSSTYVLVLLLLKILTSANASVPYVTHNPETSSGYAGLPVMLIESKPNTFDLPEDLSDVTKFVDEHGNLLGKTKFFNTPFPKPVFFCPRDSKSDSFPLYPEKFGDEDSLVCEKDPNPVIRKVKPTGETPADTMNADNQVVNCGQEKKGILYKYTYEFESNDTELENENPAFPALKKDYPTDLEIYRICYDHNSERVLYTQYQIKSPLLLENEMLKSEREKFYDKMTYGYQYFGNNFTNKKAVYEEIEKSEVKTPMKNKYGYEMYKVDKFQYQPEQLVNPNHMAFASWRKPTFHFVNFDLMNKDLKERWNLVDLIIKTNAVKEPSVPFTVYTGAFVDKIVHKLTYSDTETEIPYIWIKVVIKPEVPNDLTQPFKGTVIIVNNRMDGNMLHSMINQYCHDNKLKLNARNKYVRFCPVTSHIQELFDLDINISGELLKYEDAANIKIPKLSDPFEK